MKLINKKKILILIDWFFPGYKAGGPIRSSLNLAFALKEIYNIYILTTDTDHGEAEPYKNITSNKWINFSDDIKIFYAKKSNLKTSQIKNEIKFIAPDYIYLNHLFSPYFVLYPLWLKYVRKIKTKIIVCPRGALYDSALSVKSYKKKPVLKLLKLMKIQDLVVFHATNEREQSAIENYFPYSKIIVADNLPASNQPKFISCEKIKNVLKCVFISRIVAIKNLLFLLEILETVKSHVFLSIIGPIEDKVYWEECQKKIKVLPNNIKCNYEGAKHNYELATVFKHNHLFVLPTIGENYGHSIFEALFYGRPVLVSDQTPWLDLENKKAGWDISLNNRYKFKKIIEGASEWDQNEFDEHAKNAWQYAHRFIKNSVIKERYMQLFS